ncbi:MAG: STAS domain-containing protein [Pseudomonadota bacterium]
MSETIALQERLDGAAAVELSEALSKLPTDGSVVLDGSEVKHFGALTLQVMLSAAKTYRDNNGSITCVNLPERAASQVAAMGIDCSNLMEVFHDA